MATGQFDVTLSSLPLQIFVYFNGGYLPLFFLIECLVFMYKGTVLPYPGSNLAAEVVLLFLYAAVEACRLFFGAKGNLTQRKVPLLVALGLSIPVLFGYLFFLLWQTYVLRLEVILVGIGMVLLGFQILFSLVTVWAFLRQDSIR
ncbi:transmembrane protein 216-like [Corticium candelabrum]|uniref:transmembrane protein 216-like n=1 Tax=Corticium candelabrum TaxID=121492 RepID=UPI002E2636B7|nr:transmembrane protein 216-like [Corticium candelabrum]